MINFLLFFFVVYSESIYIPFTTGCLVHDDPTEDADYVGGAAGSQGKEDISPSKYFTSIDAYNLKSCGSLHILPNFKTYQQTSFYSCGVASAIMAINYLNKSDVACEKTLYDAMGTSAYRGTSPIKLKDGLNNYAGASGTYVAEMNADAPNGDADFEDDVDATGFEKFKDFVIKAIDNNEVLIMLSNNWGGHYEVIIGYDDMGTSVWEDDDVLIMADPYDTTDHFQEGYTIWSAWRFYAMWHGSTWTYYRDDEYEDSDPPYSSTYIKVKPLTPKSNPHTAVCSLEPTKDEGHGLMRITTENLILLFSLFFLISAWL